MTVELSIEEAERLYRTGDFPAAEAAARNVLSLSQPSERQVYGRFFDFMCQCAFLQERDPDRLVRIEEYCRADMTAHGPTFWNQLHLGALHQWQRRFDAAEMCWEAARALPFGANHRGAGAYSSRSFGWMDTILSATEPLHRATQPQLFWLDPQREGTAGPVFLVSCNSKYLQDWLPIYATSLHKACPNALVHLHVVRPDADDRALIDEVRRALPTMTFNATAETPAILDSFKRSDTVKAYYASARFIRLEQLALHYRSDFFVSDIDLIFNADPSPLLAEMGDAAIGLRLSNMHAFFPWTFTGANFAAVRFTPDAMRFFWVVSEYCLNIFHHADVQHPQWYIDQNALTHAHEYTKARQEGPGVINLNTMALSRFVRFGTASKAEFRAEAMRLLGRS
ncbi:hypothetical protein [Roseomonas sp. BN140053]|uniref:hypothetical protein n=1 Tax=Roseomonas sp. BN140053 TaxID=3391898 RepID=UPI0039EB692C